MKVLSALVKAVRHLVKCSDCCIYRQALTTKNIFTRPAKYFATAFEINRIKNRALNTLLFRVLYEEAESE